MRKWFPLALALAATTALADRMPMPADAPAEFKTECGSCHLAFPPVLLTSRDWQKVMASLEKHYGDNASLDNAINARIRDFLVRNAGEDRRVRDAGDPPRITRTAWFRHEHDEVSANTWRDPGVKSAANCAACHRRAEQGSFGERDIVMPGGRRHHEER
jgi:hypothetical protein